MAQNDNTRRVRATGEMALDIVFKDNKPVAAVPGGSALNAIVSLARSGTATSFVSTTGDDYAGRLMLDFLNAEGVDTSGVNMIAGMKSTVSLAVLDNLNNASYSFYRDPRQLAGDSAPTMSKDDILLLSSFYAVSHAARPTTLAMLNEANNAGALVVYDINFRPSHKADLPSVMPALLDNISRADIVRASCEDLQTVFGSTDATEVWRHKLSDRCRLMIVTDGEKPTTIVSDGFVERFDVQTVDAVSTIGAGDNYNAGLIYALIAERLTRHDITHHAAQLPWQRLTATAAAFAADCCKHTGNNVSREFGQRMQALSASRNARSI